VSCQDGDGGQPLAPLLEEVGAEGGVDGLRLPSSLAEEVACSAPYWYGWLINTPSEDSERWGGWICRINDRPRDQPLLANSQLLTGCTSGVGDVPLLAFRLITNCPHIGNGIYRLPHDEYQALNWT
jgi:hypothetical protein